MQLPFRRDSFDPEAICRSYRPVEAPLIVMMSGVMQWREGASIGELRI
jgi:hypothetical protein